MNLEQVIPHLDTLGYQIFMEREIPSDDDRIKARSLLDKLSDSQRQEIATWWPSYRESLTLFAYGKVKHGLVPHNNINFVARYFGLKWDGKRYEYR